MRRVRLPRAYLGTCGRRLRALGRAAATDWSESLASKRSEPPSKKLMPNSFWFNPGARLCRRPAAAWAIARHALNLEPRLRGRMLRLVCDTAALRGQFLPNLARAARVKAYVVSNSHLSPRGIYSASPLTGGGGSE